MGWVLVALVVLDVLTAKTAAIAYLVAGALMFVVAVAAKAPEK
jgi:hypothetical protein